MTSFQKIQQKIKNTTEAVQIISQWKRNQEAVVFTNGCFDLIHTGHLRYLAEASDLGHRFVIAVNSDASVSRIKGKGRPIKDEQTRMLLLAALSFVDLVVLFDEDTPAEIIAALKPDILVKGGDYEEENIVGADMVKQNGGKVVVIPFVEGYSTSNYEQKIIDNYTEK